MRHDTLVLMGLVRFFCEELNIPAPINEVSQLFEKMDRDIYGEPTVGPTKQFWDIDSPHIRSLLAHHAQSPYAKSL